MAEDLRRLASETASKWPALEGAITRRVEVTQGALRRVGAYVAWLEHALGEERLRRIELEREAARRTPLTLEVGLSFEALVCRVRDHLTLACAQDPERMERALAALAQPRVDAAIRDTLATCQRYAGSEVVRGHMREAVESRVGEVGP
jgi:hypothetical protein